MTICSGHASLATRSTLRLFDVTTAADTGDGGSLQSSRSHLRLGAVFHGPRKFEVRLLVIAATTNAALTRFYRRWNSILRELVPRFIGRMTLNLGFWCLVLVTALKEFYWDSILRETVPCLLGRTGLNLFFWYRELDQH